MTDEVTHEQFNRFLEAKAPEKPCPECGTNHWLIQGQQLPDGSTTLAGLFLTAENGGAAAVYVMFCSNCGFQKSYRKSAVTDWVKQNG